VIAVACLLAATLAVFGDVLLAGDRVLLSTAGDDMTRPFFYWLPFAFGELRKGHLVLWNPYNYAGAAYFGGFGPALLYPPNWIHMVLPTVFAINATIAVHIFLSGLWTYCWTAHRGLRPAACVLAGLVYMFSGAVFLQIYRGHLHCLTTLTWTPLIFLAIDGVLDAGRGARTPWVVLGMAAVALQIFAGHVQYIFYTAMIAGAYGLACWLRFSRAPRDAVALLLIYPGGACLAAVQLFTGLQAASETLRSGISYDVAASFPFPPENVLTLALPGIFGDMVSSPYWGRWTLTEMSLFIGVAPFALALCGLVGGDARAKRFSLVMILLVLLLAFGDYTPLFHFLYDHFPGFQNFRGTTKFIYLADLFAVMLVAVGFDRVLRSGMPRWLVAVALVVGALLLAAGIELRSDCASGGGRFWLPGLKAMPFFADAYENYVIGRQPASLQACAGSAASLLIGGATFTLTAVLGVAARGRRRVAYVLAVLGVVEVMTYARHTRPTFDPAPLARWSTELRRFLDDNAAGDARVASHDPYSYVAMGARAYDLWGADPTVLARYARFLAVTQGWPVDAVVVTSGLRVLSPLLGMLRLRYAFDATPTGQVIVKPTNLRELPRALLVPQWQVVPDEQHALDGLRDRAFDPRRVVLLEHDPGLESAAADQTDDVGDITVQDVSTEAIDVTADVHRAAILLVTDNYSARWTASPLDVGDTRTYRVEPGDYLLRAVPLTPGHHHFRLAYRPSALPVGAAVTVLTMAACAILLARARVPRPPRARQ
jgi:hypothetical protein